MKSHSLLKSNILNVNEFFSTMKIRLIVQLTGRLKRMIEHCSLYLLFYFFQFSMQNDVFRLQCIFWHHIVYTVCTDFLAFLRQFLKIEQFLLLAQTYFRNRQFLDVSYINSSIEKYFSLPKRRQI